jgi:acetoin utilization deacetylase AcuC-like enzyme
MLPFMLIYSDDYFLPIGAHVFPAEKYKRVHDRLLATKVAEPADFIAPHAATDEDILLVHSPRYVEKLKNGTLSAHEELQLEIPYSPDLVQAFWLAAGGSMVAADQHWWRISSCLPGSWGRFLHDQRHRGRDSADAARRKNWHGDDA